MIVYRRLHEIVLIILIMGMLNLYDIIKNVEISVYEVLNINEKNIIYLLLITLLFFFIFFHSNIIEKDSIIYSMEYELILGLGLIGLSFLIFSNDLILFFLALELYSLSVYLLLFKNEINKARISILYFLLGSISSSFILLAFSILYSYTGSLDLKYIIENIEVIMKYHKEDEIILLMGFALFLLGLLFKLGSAPFQFWVIRVYTQMDLKVLIYQSIIPKIAYIYIISKILNNFNYSNNSISSLFLFLLLFSALLSLFLGPLGGLTHGVNQFKTIIAYSSILHVGYLLLGLVSNFFNENIESVGLNLFQYLLIYAFNTFHFLLAFFFLQSLYNKRSINITILLLNFLISIFSFIGLPPFAGFYAKLNIIINCYYTNNILLQIFGIIFILVSTLIALFLYLKFINYLYLNPTDWNYFNSVELNHKTDLYSFLFSYLLSFFSLFLLFYPFFLPFLSPIFEILSL